MSLALFLKKSILALPKSNSSSSSGSYYCYCCD